MLNSHDFDKIKHKGLSDLIEGNKEPAANSSGSPSQSAPKNTSGQESLSEFPTASGDDISERPGTPPAKGEGEEGDDDEADSATSNLPPRTLKDLADFREKLLTVDKWVKDTDFYEACEDEQTQRMGKQYMGRLHDFLLNVEVNEEVIANGKRVGEAHRKALLQKLKEDGRLDELDDESNKNEEAANLVSQEDKEPKYPLVKRFQTNKDGGVTCVDVPTDDLLKKRNGNLFQGTEPARKEESNGALPMLGMIKEEQIKKESASPQPGAGSYLDAPSLPPPTPGGPPGGAKRGKRKRNSIDHENYAHIVKKMHLTPPEYQCTICNRQFKNRLNIRYHIACADKSAGHACKECTRIFKSSSHLTYHMRTAHGGEKPYKCSFCEKAFAQSVKLKRHERTHTGERPFKCDVCQHTFTTKYNLKEHENIHKSEKPYSCQTCSMRFADRNNLRRHEMTHNSAAVDLGSPSTPMAFHERLGLPSPRKMPKVESFQEKIDKVSQDWRILMEKRKRDRLFSDHQAGSLADSFRKSMFPSTNADDVPNPALPLFDSSNTEAVNLFHELLGACPLPRDYARIVVGMHEIAARFGLHLRKGRLS